MQISGSSNISEYYALMRQQRSQQAAQGSSATEGGTEAKASGSGNSFIDAYTQATSETSETASAMGGPGGGTPPPAPPAGGGGGGGMSSSTETETLDYSIPGDTDGDGELSSEELASWLAEQEQSAQSGASQTEMAAQEGARPSGPPPSGPPPGGMNGMSSTSQEWSASLNYSDLMGSGDSSQSGNASAYMQSMIRSAYGA